MVSVVCLQGIKVWNTCWEFVNRLDVCWFPYYLTVHLYWMLLYDIILYKHVFEKYLCLTLISCYLVFFPFGFPWFHLSAYVFLIMLRQPPLHLIVTRRCADNQSEKTFAMTTVPGCRGLLCTTALSISAGLHVNRHRDNVSMTLLLSVWVAGLIPLRSRQDCYSWQ